jgi:thiamine biosynthesis lipoprotein
MTAPAPVLGSTRAMASDITLFGTATTVDGSAVDEAFTCFDTVQDACTRFDPDSPLMRANARPDEWHPVPPVLLDALRESYRAYVRTGGRFDPRVHDDLIRLGYDRTFRFVDDQVETVDPGHERAPLAPWAPRFRDGPAAAVHLDGVPVDLGGIGKTFALRRAVKALRQHVDHFLLDAGGDCFCAGPGPEGDGWRVGVEDPAGGTRPVAVLALTDRGCATSSTRLRRWRCGGRPVHHLLDPATGRPGGRGLVAVTVVDPDPVRAEVATKDLFLLGATGIARHTDGRGIAALWVTDDGRVTVSPALDPLVVWRAA